MMNRWQGNTGHVEHVGEAADPARTPLSPGATPARGADRTRGGVSQYAPSPGGARRPPPGGRDFPAKLGEEDLLLGLILFLLYRESRDEEFLIMLAALFLT